MKVVSIISNICIYIQPFNRVVDCPEIGCLMEVSTMFYICRYRVFTWWDRATLGDGPNICCKYECVTCITEIEMTISYFVLISVNLRNRLEGSTLQAVKWPTSG